jgi:hypothetical protein
MSRPAAPLAADRSRYPKAIEHTASFSSGSTSLITRPPRPKIADQCVKIVVIEIILGSEFRALDPRLDSPDQTFALARI